MKQTKTIVSDLKSVFGRDKVLMILLSVLFFSSLETYHSYIRLFFVFLAILSGRFWKYSDGLALWLLFFSTTYGLGLFLNSNIDAGTNFLGYLFCPIVFYLFGKKIVAKSSSNSELTSFLLLCILLFGLKVYLITLSDISQGILISLSRLEETDTTSATLLSATVSLGMVGLSAFGAFVNPVKNFKSWLYALIFFMSILAATHQISRTGVVIGFLVTIMFYVYKSRHHLLLLIFLLSLGLYVVWQLSIFEFFNNEVLEAYVSRMDDYDKSMGDDGGRIYRWSYALDKMVNNLGGWSTTEFVFVHNFWLDVQKVAGILPLFSLLVVTILSCKNQILLLLFKEDNSFVTISFGINVCMLLTSFVEPILQGNATYIYFMFMLWGMQAQYLTSYNHIETNE